MSTVKIKNNWSCAIATHWRFNNTFALRQQIVYYTMIIVLANGERGKKTQQSRVKSRRGRVIKEGTMVIFSTVSMSVNKTINFRHRVTCDWSNVMAVAMSFDVNLNYAGLARDQTDDARNVKVVSWHGLQTTITKLIKLTKSI